MGRNWPTCLSYYGPAARPGCAAQRQETTWLAWPTVRHDIVVTARRSPAAVRPPASSRGMRRGPSNGSRIGVAQGRCRAWSSAVGLKGTGVATLKRRSLDPAMLQQRQWPPTVVSGPEGILQHRASSEEIKECLIGTKADSWRLSPKEREGSGCGFGCGGRRPIPVVGWRKG
jgi:hypothetical protein